MNRAKFSVSTATQRHSGKGHHPSVFTAITCTVSPRPKPISSHHGHVSTEGHTHSAKKTPSIFAPNNRAEIGRTRHSRHPDQRIFVHKLRHEQPNHQQLHPPQSEHPAALHVARNPTPPAPNPTRYTAPPMTAPKSSSTQRNRRRSFITICQVSFMSRFVVALKFFRVFRVFAVPLPLFQLSPLNFCLPSHLQPLRRSHPCKALHLAITHRRQLRSLRLLGVRQPCGDLPLLWRISAPCAGSPPRPARTAFVEASLPRTARPRARSSTQVRPAPHQPESTSPNARPLAKLANAGALSTTVTHNTFSSLFTAAIRPIRPHLRPLARAQLLLRFHRRLAPTPTTPRRETPAPPPTSVPPPPPASAPAWSTLRSAPHHLAPPSPPSRRRSVASFRVASTVAGNSSFVPSAHVHTSLILHAMK